MRTRAVMFAAALMVLAPLAAAEAQNAPAPDGPTIAVVAFGSDAIDSAWYWACCSRMWAAGHGIADMVATELQRDLRGRAPRVLDREVLHDFLIAERLHRRDQLSIATAARVARELDADLAVLGQTREFEAFRISRFLHGGDWAQGRVILHAKIIDARSGVVVGEENATSFRVRAVHPWDIGDRPRTDIGSSRFEYSFLGRTTSEAARSMAGRLHRAVQTLTSSGAWQTSDGPTVVGIGGGKLTINHGENDGVAPGDEFTIIRVDRRDGSRRVLGTLKVREVEATRATGRIDRIEDTPPPRPGDLAEATGQ
ncbi:MAG: hypothetical protein ACLFU7_02340 [Armatimonadota bacterium]